MVTSCWLFLYDLYYDARIQEHQAYKQNDAHCNKFNLLLILINSIYCKI